MWVSLLLATAALVAVLHLAGLPASVLLGSMGAAIAFASRGRSVRIPAPAFTTAQAVVGCLIARSFTPELFGTLAHHVGLFVGVTLSVLVLATGLGLALMRLRVLPGSAALWGSFPGAASVMVLMSDAHGADMRLVAFMQYLRIVVVVGTASVVGRLAGGTGVAHSAPWLGPIAWPSFAVTCALVLAGGVLVPRYRIARSPLLVTLIAGVLLQTLAHLRLELPPLVLGASYAVLGWAIGMRFTREILVHVRRALPRVLAAIATLVVACVGFGVVVSHVAHLDPLTAYFATSPGGADAMAILVAGTPVDAPLVMAIQLGRSITIMLVGPAIARRVARFGELRFERAVADERVS